VPVLKGIAVRRSPRTVQIIACAFFTVETVPLKRLYVLVFVEHGIRRLHLGGVTAHPTGAWAVHAADGAVNGAKTAAAYASRRPFAFSCVLSRRRIARLARAFH
jgi:hypothetical protein